MTEETIEGAYNVRLTKENPDGSAVFEFDFPPEAIRAFTRLGILAAIEAGIENAKKLDPEARLDLLGDEDECI